jgi:hypothetical protein
LALKLILGSDHTRFQVGGGMGSRCGGLGLTPTPEKTVNFGQKIPFFKKNFANPQDFYKYAIEFHSNF